MNIPSKEEVFDGLMSFFQTDIYYKMSEEEQTIITNAIYFIWAQPHTWNLGNTEKAINLQEDINKSFIPVSSSPRLEKAREAINNAQVDELYDSPYEHFTRTVTPPSPGEIIMYIIREAPYRKDIDAHGEFGMAGKDIWYKNELTDRIDEYVTRLLNASDLQAQDELASEHKTSKKASPKGGR